MSAEDAGGRDNAVVRFLKRKWLAIVLVVLLLIVAIQNGIGNDQATIYLLWAQLRMPTWVLVVAVFVVGGVVGWVLARSRAARKARR